MPRKIAFVFLLILGAVALPSAGCRREAKPRLLLYCGAGIRPPVAEIVQVFEKKHNIAIETDYAGSNILLSRIKLTRRGDLYMPGDALYVEQARREGLIASSRDACYFVPVILVRKGNPKGIRGAADFVRKGLRIGLGDPQACAIGNLTVRILERNGISPAQVEPNVVFRSLTVNELGLHIKTGNIDATVVWDATAAEYSGDGDVVPIPKDKNLISTVPVAVLRSSKFPKHAAALQAFVVSEEGRAIFAKHHYTTEAPP